MEYRDVLPTTAEYRCPGHCCTEEREDLATTVQSYIDNQATMEKGIEMTWPLLYRV
jgi:hypothetical protein